MKMNLKLLATFLAVAENASFRKAAEQANLSLPAVSMQVKQLEEQLGVALFQRTTRRVELTQEGEQLMISGRKAMAEIEAGLTAIQHAADVQQGRLAFACVPTVSGTRLPRILARFAELYPGIHVQLRELANKDLLEAVRRREVDFAIGPIPEKRGDLDFVPLFTDETCALLPRGYPDGGRAGIPLRELARGKLLKLSGSTSFRDHLDDALREHGLETQTDYEFVHVTTLVAMAEAGLGIAVMPRVAIPPHTALKVVRVIAPALSRTVAIVTIRGHSLSPAAGRLVELCEQMIAEVPAEVAAAPAPRRKRVNAA